ncbi:hypothetical protein LINPERPRIM_LOCUS23514 [Linum perenne]
MAGGKRGYGDLRPEELEIVIKRVKLRNQESVLKAKGLDCSQVERSGTTMNFSDEVNPIHGQIDLNSEACETNESNMEGFPDRENCSAVVNRCNIDSAKGHKGRKISRDISECASRTTDPLTVWRDDKENWTSSQRNRLIASSRYGGIPVPNRQERNDIVKKRMEIAKKEEVDRLAKIAAPSGLLNGLNLGIINHVRNSKQVRTIIGSLVSSEKVENGREESCKGVGVTAGSLVQQSIHAHGKGSNPLCSKSSSSSIKVSKKSTSVSKKESTDAKNVSCLAFKSATVASEWLELLRQDTEGRLIALQRSRNRVRDVIATELPLLISNKFSTSNKGNAAMHKAKWTKLFVQMDTALSEQQIQLETLLNQLKEMQLQCDQGLQNSQPLLRISERYGMEISKKELTVRAAAASIYSTCQLVMSKENVPCL